MNTLVLDLWNLVSNHFTTVEDVFINYHDHIELKKVNIAVRTGDVGGMLYFLQRYEYQRQTINVMYWIAHQSNNTKLMNLLKTRYNLDVLAIIGYYQFVHNILKTTTTVIKIGVNKLKKIKANLGIKYRDVKWLLDRVNIYGYLDIVETLASHNNFDVLFDNMTKYILDDHSNRSWITILALILALLGRLDQLHEFMKPHSQHTQSLNMFIISASIRTDNLELFIKFFNPSESSVCDRLAYISKFGAIKILKYVLETYHPKHVTYIQPTTILTDPRIARMLVNQKDLQINGLNELIKDCRQKACDVVVKILSTRN